MSVDACGWANPLAQMPYDERMLIVGERINTSRKVKGEPVIERAVVARDAGYVSNLARAQAESGAHYIDINCGTLVEGEPEALAWLTETVQSAVPLPICFDSPSPGALEGALSLYDFKNGQPFINSITAEKIRYCEILPLIQEHGAKVVALAMDDSGIQHDPQKRFEIARNLIDRLAADGIPHRDIYLDPMTFPIGSGDDVGLAMMSILERITAEYPKVHKIAGLSNISHGMPARKVLNCAMTLLCMDRGLDAAILDPQDRMLMGLIAAAEALLGQDEYCCEYIGKARAGAFEGL